MQYHDTKRAISDVTAHLSPQKQPNYEIQSRKPVEKSSKTRTTTKPNFGTERPSEGDDVRARRRTVLSGTLQSVRPPSEKRPDAGRRDAVRLHTAGVGSIGTAGAEGHAHVALSIYDPLIPFVYGVRVNSRVNGENETRLSPWSVQGL